MAYCFVILEDETGIAKLLVLKGDIPFLQRENCKMQYLTGR